MSRANVNVKPHVGVTVVVGPTGVCKEKFAMMLAKSCGDCQIIHLGDCRFAANRIAEALEEFERLGCVDTIFALVDTGDLAAAEVLDHLADMSAAVNCGSCEQPQVAAIVRHAYDVLLSESGVDDLGFRTFRTFCFVAAGEYGRCQWVPVFESQK